MINLIRVTLIIATAASLSACLGGAAKNSSGDQRARAMDMNERALAIYEKGDSRLALQMLDDAMKVSASIDDQDGTARALLNMSRVARKNGDTKSASEYVDRALSLNRGNALLADANQEKAIQELLAGRLEEAESWAEKALTAESGELKGRRLNLMARISYKKGDYTRSQKLLEQAVSANSSEILKEELANSLRLLGVINTKNGMFLKAGEQLDEALIIDKKLELPSKIADDLEAFADLYKAKGDSLKLESFKLRAQNVREAIKKSSTQNTAKPNQINLERQQ